MGLSPDRKLPDKRNAFVTSSQVSREIIQIALHVLKKILPQLFVLSLFLKLRVKNRNLNILAVDIIGESPIKSDVKLGPQTHFGAKSQSEGTIELVPET